MCERKRKLIEDYAENERTWKSAMSSDAEKVTAWRNQLFLLKGPIQQLRGKDSNEFLKRHYTRLDTDCMSEYRKQRNNGMERWGTRQKFNGDIDLFEDIDFEPGFEPYQGGKHDFQKTNELLWQSNKKCTHVQENVNDFDKPTTSRSCMEKFFTPPKQTNPYRLTVMKKAKDVREEKNANNPTEKEEDTNAFRTAREILITNNFKKQNPEDKSSNASSSIPTYFNYGATKKLLGTRRTVRSEYVLPLANHSTGTAEINPSPPLNQSPTINSSGEMVDERLTNIDPKMVDLIKNEIMHKYKPMDWSDIAGLDYVKSIIKEAVVYPLLRPDIYTGLRRPPRGILLFGPPGTGKTLIGKCIASRSNSTFFSISASSLTSKWVGESEKMVRALFAVAAVHQPSVIFIDEVDSLLSKRSEMEHDSSRKLKNEFLVQLDGAATSEEDRVLIVGATNRPQELDDAARRRFARRLYIPLPEMEARIQILKNLISTVSNNLNEGNISEIGQQTVGYSGADMDILCREASMEPLRAIPADQIPHISKDSVRPVNLEDFKSSLHSVRPSVSKDDLAQYIQWNKEYGALQKQK